jgi:hypothetical protein
MLDPGTLVKPLEADEASIIVVANPFPHGSSAERSTAHPPQDGADVGPPS